VDEARNVSVVLVYATVLGNLRSACGVDYALNGSHDDVWDGGVLEWVAKALGDKLRAVNDVLDPEVDTLRVKTGHGFVGIGMVRKEDESDVVRCLERDFDTGCGGYKSLVDFSVLCGVNWCLSMLRANGDESIFIDILRLYS
jgi:hypothetical protein